MSSSTTPIDKKALKQKYLEERDKRIRADGNNQYQSLEGKLAHYAEDPYTPIAPREPKRDHVTFAFVGGGFGGLVTGARLVEAGVEDVRIVEAGGDFGGTWYWNRYPGAQCDTAAFVYMPLCEETGHMPSEKYAHGPEILEQAQRIGRHYGLYENALFHTKVLRLVWDENASRWIIHTHRGDEFTATFVGLGTGLMHVPKLPGIPGIEAFKGHSFHTSRWDYDYTGGDSKGARMQGLADKRVAIIGTGATAVQVVSRVARDAKELLVFQRTPSSVDVRNNCPTDPAWFAEIAKPGWQQLWMDSFTAQIGFGAPPTEDLVQDGWTDLNKRTRDKIRALPRSQRTTKGMLEALEDSDNEKMQQIRDRVSSIVKDDATAEKLKAWYRQLCKRPCFHDEYLNAFNQPSVQLVDTDGKGVERVTESGVVAQGKEYPVDCIVYASGFHVGFEKSAFNLCEIVGRNGVTLTDYWAEGMRSKHGIHVHGFPNAFLVQPSQGAMMIANVPSGINDSAKTIAAVVKHAVRNSLLHVEVSKEAESDWVDLCVSMRGSSDCTPGYYNNEGQPDAHSQTNIAYPAGPWAFFKYIDEWRNSGSFDGIQFSSPKLRSRL